jgi:flagellar hook-length control protein FliK
VIPAIDPGIGLKEDRPAPRVPQTENPGFSHVLHRTVGASEKASQRSLDEARAPGDNRARRAYGREPDAADKAADHPPDKPAEKTAGQTASQAAGKTGHKTGATGEAHPQRKAAHPDEQEQEPGANEAAGDLNAAAQQVGNPQMQATPPGQESLGDVVDPKVASLALESVDTGQHVGGPNDATPITAEIGSAAYRLGPHGKGEAALAEARGLILPDSVQEQMLGQGVRDVKQATFQKPQPSDLPAPAIGAVASETDILQPADKHAAKESKGLSYREQIALQTAQARNDVLSRLAATGGETAGGGVNPGASDALRHHMQLQGLLARDARQHVLEPANPNAPPTVLAGAVPAANSVDLTQVYETPHDDAVQHRVVERVASEAHWMISNDRQEVTIRLSPEHLGNLHMKVLHKDGVFNVHLTVDNLTAKHLLESNLQDLRNRLVGDHPGGEFLFNVDVRHGNEQPSLYARRDRPAPAGVGRVGALEEAPAPGMAGRVLGHSGLSIYV